MFVCLFNGEKDQNGSYLEGNGVKEIFVFFLLVFYFGEMPINIFFFFLPINILNATDDAEGRGGL